MTSKRQDFNLSIEVFPPNDEFSRANFWSEIEDIADLDPNLISVTYGAGGSSQANSTTSAKAIAIKFGLDVAGHLTCVGASRDHVLEVARNYWEGGVRSLVALRGDGDFERETDSFANPIELIRSLKQLYNFEFYVAAYPTPHPKAKNQSADIEFLKRKFDAGADKAITQFFFEAEDFLRFRDKCIKAGINNTIIPGILPIENWNKAKSFTQRCGVPLSKTLDATFAKVLDKSQHDLLSIAIATELCDDLLSEGVEDLHFYTLNRAELTTTICKALGRTSNKLELKRAS